MRRFSDAVVAKSPSPKPPEVSASPLVEGRDDPVSTAFRPPAEAQLAGMVVAHLLIDPDHAIRSANQAAETLLGTSAQRLEGRAVLDIVAPLDPRIAPRLTAPDEALVARDITVRTGDDERRVDLTISPLGGYPGWRVVTLAPFGHEENGGEDRASLALAAPSVLAHEIKNPLAAIRGAGQLAARKLPEADRKLARMITDEVDRIARLIDRMQQLGSRRSEACEPCNPHEAIRAAIATVRAATTGDGAGDAEGKAAEIVEQFDPSLPPVLANRDALEQVLINLVANASEAAGPQGEVTVRTRFVSGQVFSAIRLGRAVRLPIEVCVSDNGAGIDPQLREHVFEPFVSSKPAGQGLGLALVRKLVRDMNGSISHERDGRRGLTHFRVHLPMARTERA